MDWNETITSLIGVEPIILKGDENIPLLKALQQPLDLADYPLMEELYNLIQTRYADSEEKHKRPEDILAHHLYARSLHDFIVHTKPKKVVELGILNGVSSTAFMRALCYLKEGHLWSFDPWTGYINWWWMIPEWERYWNYYTMLGEAGFEQYGNEIGEIDMLYIDTAHTYDDTVKFLNQYWIGNVRRGGYVVIDDCCPQFQAEVDRSKIPSDYWAEASGYGILRPVIEFLEWRDRDIEFAFVINTKHSTGISIIKFKN